MGLLLKTKHCICLLLHIEGMINLKDCDKVISREPIKGHRHVFDVCTEDRIYHLAAETAAEKRNWIDTLNTLLFTEQVCTSR